MEQDEFENTIPKHKQELLKWNGWGYKDCKWSIKDSTLTFHGGRYEISNAPMKNLLPWIQKTFNVVLPLDTDLEDLPFDAKLIPEPIQNAEFYQEIISNQEKYNYTSCQDPIDRFYHSKGQTLKEVYMSKNLNFGECRVVDLVVWPTTEEGVSYLIQLCNEKNVVIIPFGGGTSVSGALLCPKNENRVIMSMDMSEMNRIVWIDHENLTVCVDAGIVGQDLEKRLNKYGYTVGHEPDSIEFSTVGGWVSTRASGMQKNEYGNIEDLLVHVTYITPSGTIYKKPVVPRISCGPDLHQLVLGSEGTMGVITTVVLKIRPVPLIKEYNSIVFTNFESGIRFCRQIAKERAYCASIRLLDNLQFQFGRALKPEPEGFYENMMDKVSRYYVASYKGIDVTKMAVATLMFVGKYNQVESQKREIFRIAALHGGFSGGSENGRRGYNLTQSIAYLRDLALKFKIISESFETSAPWDKVESLINNVKSRIVEGCEKYDIKNPFVSSRVTQMYDAGACIYFYMGLYILPSVDDPLEVYEEIESLARDEVIANGGCISHHHGVGNVRRKWYKDTISNAGYNVVTAVKKELDPNNIFANGNLTNPSFNKN